VSRSHHSGDKVHGLGKDSWGKEAKGAAEYESDCLPRSTGNRRHRLGIAEKGGFFEERKNSYFPMKRYLPAPHSRKSNSKWNGGRSLPESRCTGEGYVREDIGIHSGRGRPRGRIGEKPLPDLSGEKNFKRCHEDIIFQKKNDKRWHTGRRVGNIQRGKCIQARSRGCLFLARNPKKTDSRKRHQ